MNAVHIWLDESFPDDDIGAYEVVTRKGSTLKRFDFASRESKRMSYLLAWQWMKDYETAKGVEKERMTRRA